MKTGGNMQDWSLSKLHKDRELWVAALIVALAVWGVDQMLLNSLLVFLGGRLAIRTGAVISAGRESAAETAAGVPTDDPFATDGDGEFDRDNRHPEIVELLNQQDAHDGRPDLDQTLEELAVEGEDEFTGGEG